MPAPTHAANDRGFTAAPALAHALARVVVVLPAYNEAAVLGLLLQRLDEAMREDDTDYEIIVVDDGSTDATVRIVQDYMPYVRLRLERHDVNRGLGTTIRDGLKAAVSVTTDQDIIVVMDADNTHTPGLIRTMCASFGKGRMSSSLRDTGRGRIPGRPVPSQALEHRRERLAPSLFSDSRGPRTIPAATAPIGPPCCAKRFADMATASSTSRVSSAWWTSS